MGYDGKKMAMKYDIEIVGFSSDGDRRLLKAMRSKAAIPVQNKYNSWFQINPDIFQAFYVQDTIHIISKDKHLLTKSHLKSDDKMNFDAVEKMVSEKVQVSLTCIPNSEGTTAYLKITQLILDAFLKKDLDIRTRIRKICMLDILHRMHKLQKINEILCDLENVIVFPRQKQSGDDKIENNTPLPNFDEIQSIINGVIPEVEEKYLDGLENEDIVLEKEVNKSMENTVSGEGLRNQDKDFSEEVSEPEIDLEDLKDIDLIDYSSKSRKNSPYVKVISKNKEIMVKKNTLYWLLENKNGRLSSDQLERVKGPKSFTKTGPKHNSVKNKAIMRKTFTTSVKTVGKKAKKKVEC
ncbi:hypothetical protein NQ314_012500 [Rhamnusium bicolor]|uniref:Uncharacterized protein n=1 Tax=Rhamnusium bicolor TaxID=1586634 RepID=A0AAV8XC71_9CUCU|nr:hypothetical protein NQ314_012500 [Rhamnusium bicolor]